MPAAIYPAALPAVVARITHLPYLWGVQRFNFSFCPDSGNSLRLAHVLYFAGFISGKAFLREGPISVDAARICVYRPNKLLLLTYILQAPGMSFAVQYLAMDRMYNFGGGYV
jgi:hypothetical protein